MIHQHPGPGVLDVPRGGEQDDWPRPGQLDEVAHRVGGRRLSQLGPVASGELLEAIHRVAVPATELGAGRHVLEPFVQPRLVLGDPARPETVDQDSSPRRKRMVVDPMDLERQVPIRIRNEPTSNEKWRQP